MIKRSIQNKAKLPSGSLVLNDTTDEPRLNNMKGKTMTEVTNTETQAVELTPMQKAEEFVKTNSMQDIVMHIVSKEENVENLDRICQDLRRSNSALRDELKNWRNSISEFIKEKVKEDAVDVDDLKELADELNIELTKRIKVTFRIDVEGEFDVPLDYDQDKADEDFFDITIEANPPAGEDIDIYSEEWNVENLEVEEVNS